MKLLSGKKSLLSASKDFLLFLINGHVLNPFYQLYPVTLLQPIADWPILFQAVILHQSNTSPPFFDLALMKKDEMFSSGMFS